MTKEEARLVRRELDSIVDYKDLSSYYIDQAKEIQSQMYDLAGPVSSAQSWGRISNTSYTDRASTYHELLSRMQMFEEKSDMYKRKADERVMWIESLPHDLKAIAKSKFVDGATYDVIAECYSVTRSGLNNKFARSMEKMPVPEWI